MEQEKKNWGFSLKEVLFIFFLLVFLSVLVFGLGIMVGKGIRETRISEMKKLALQEAAKLEEEQKDKITPEGAKEPLADTEIEKKREILSEENIDLENQVKTEIGKELFIQDKDLIQIEDVALGNFTIQVKNFERQEEALLYVEMLKKKGFPSVYITKAKVGTKVLYFVDLGRFRDDQEAKKLGWRLLNRGLIDSYFIRKIN